MWSFLLGAAAGYVLGSRAGRERYEQIVRTYQSVAENPTVQNAVRTATGAAKNGAAQAAGAMTGRSNDRA